MKKLLQISVFVVLLVGCSAPVEAAFIGKSNLGTVKINTTGRTVTVGTSQSQRNRFASHLMGYWSFNGKDMVGTTSIMDLGSVKQNGTLQASVFGAQPKFVPGKVGQALSFDGVDDYVYTADGYDPPTITLTAWVKPSVVKTNMIILSKRINSGTIFPQYGMGTHDSEADKFRAAFFSSSVSSDVCESSSNSYTANSWTFIAATYDGDTCKIYINGVDDTTVASDVASGNLRNSTARVFIGSDPGLITGGTPAAAGTYFAGVIDEPKIYGRVLTATEILQLYNANK